MNTTDRTFQEIVDAMIDAIRQMAMTDSDKIRLVSGLAFLQTRYELDTKPLETIESAGIYDAESVIYPCTVQVLTNSVSGETSVGWWPGDAREFLGEVEEE